MDSEAITKPTRGQGMDALKTKVGPLPAYAYGVILIGGVVGFYLLRKRSGGTSLPISAGTVSSTGAAGNGNYGSGGGSSSGSAGTTASPTVTPTVTPTPTPTTVPTTAPSTIAANGADTRVGITNYWNPDTQRYQQTPYIGGAVSMPGKKVGDPNGAGGPIIGSPASGGGSTLAPNGANPTIGVTNYWNPTTGRYQQTPVGAASSFPTVGGGWQTASGWNRVPQTLMPVGPSSPSGTDGGTTPVSSYPVYNPDGGPQ